MQTPVQLTFRSMAHSDALAAHLHHRAEKLQRIFDRIIACHVVVELAGSHHRHGDRRRFSIRVGLPGHELVVSHAPQDGHALESATANADRAFDETERQLEDWVGRQRERRHADVRDVGIP